MSKKKTNGYCHDISCPPFLEADLGLLPESIVPFSRDGRAMLRSLREYTTRVASESHTHARTHTKKQSKSINLSLVIYQKTEEEDGRSCTRITFFHNYWGGGGGGGGAGESSFLKEGRKEGKRGKISQKNNGEKRNPRRKKKTSLSKISLHKRK